MGDHGELVREMADLEKLPTADRLKMAKRRRQQQLKRFSDYDKKQEKMDRKRGKSMRSDSRSRKSAPVSSSAGRSATICFRTDIMFLEAAARNDIAEVRALLKDGVKPDVANTDGLTALHQSCIDDSLEMCILLLDHGANPNARDSELWTPFHAAATCGHLRICQVLVERGAELLAVNADGNMPYDICEAEGTLEYIEMEMASRGVTQELIDETRLSNERRILQEVQDSEDAEVPLEYRDPVGATLLHLAAGSGYEELGTYLLKAGIRIDATDNDGWTAAHAAACWGHLEMLDMLAKYGANLEGTTNCGETILDLCEDPEMKQQVEEIKKEAKTKRMEKVKQKEEIKRRSSANLRSSSVRRHSMREKRRMSQKDAQNEAKYRITINTGDDDQPDDIPVTNIDDIAMQVADGSKVSQIDVPGSNGGAPDDGTAALPVPDAATVTHTNSHAASLPRSPKMKRPQRTPTKMPSTQRRMVDSDDEGEASSGAADPQKGKRQSGEQPAPTRRLSAVISVGDGPADGHGVPPPSQPQQRGASPPRAAVRTSLTSSNGGVPEDAKRDSAGSGSQGGQPTLHELKKQRMHEAAAHNSLPRQSNGGSGGASAGNNGSLGSKTSMGGGGEGPPSEANSSGRLGKSKGYRYTAGPVASAHMDGDRRIYTHPEVIGGKEKRGCCSVM